MGHPRRRCERYPDLHGSAIETFAEKELHLVVVVAVLELEVAGGNTQELGAHHLQSGAIGVPGGKPVSTTAAEQGKGVPVLEDVVDDALPQLQVNDSLPAKAVHEILLDALLLAVEHEDGQVVGRAEGRIYDQHGRGRSSGQLGGLLLPGLALAELAHHHLQGRIQL